MKKNIGLIVGILFIVVFICLVGYNSVKTIASYANATATIDEVIADKGESISFAKGKLYYCTPRILSIRHSINGIIPTGTEYFYVMISSDESNLMVIKAPKDWDMDNFPDYYNQAGIEITGQAKRMDYEVRNALSDFLSLEKIPASYAAGTYYLDITAQTNAWIGLIGLILLCISAIMIYVLAKKNQANSKLGISAVVLLIAAFILIIMYIA